MLTKDRRSRILDNMKPLHEMLREWRELSGLSQVAAAERLGMSRQQWWYLESGETADVRTSTLVRLERCTGIPLERLVRAAEMGLSDARVDETQPVV